MTEYSEFVEILDRNIKEFSFENISSFKKIQINKIEEVQDIEKLKIWKRPSSCIVLFRLSEGWINKEDNIGEYAQKIKMKIGKELGYIPIINERGMQMIFYGPGVIKYKDIIPKYTDKINNFRVILQSIYIYDSKSLEFQSTRTWGQIFSGKYQKAISTALKEVSMR